MGEVNHPVVGPERPRDPPATEPAEIPGLLASDASR